MKFFLLFLGALPCLAHEHTRPTSAATAQEATRIRFFEARLAVNANDTISLSGLGDLLLNVARRSARHEDYQKAENIFLRHIQLDPNNPSSLSGLAYSLVGRHQFTTALGYARAAGEAHADQPGYWALLGDIHLALGNYLEADMFFSRLLTRDRSPGTLARSAQIRELRGQTQEARDLLGEALSLAQTQAASKTQLAWYHTMLADLELTSGAEQEAEKQFRKALEVAPDTSYAQWRLAQMLLHRKQPAEALALLHMPAHQEQDKVQYAFTLSRIHEALGNDGKAKWWFNKAQDRVLAEIEAGEIGHARELIAAWMEKGLNPEKTLVLARRELKEVRHDRAAHEQVAWALYLNGEGQEAVQHMEAALRPGPVGPKTLLRAGILVYHGGNPLKAAHLLHLGLNKKGYVPERLHEEAEALGRHLKDNPKELTAALMNK